METLSPRLPPSDEGSEIEKKHGRSAAGGGNPLILELQLQLVIQRVEQMELDKRALEAKFGATYRMLDKSRHWKNNPLLRDCKGKMKGGIG